MIMDYNLTHINDMIRSDPAGFVAECDRVYYGRISAAADAICANMAVSPIVLLSGPSGSGKTTSAYNLERELERRGINAHTVSFDNYFKTVDPETSPRTPEGDLDFESPQCVDADLVNAHFSMLSRGEEIQIPHFIFAEQRRSDTETTPMRLRRNEIAIFEGIHAFSDEITEKHPEAFNLFVCTASAVLCGGLRFRPTWMRLLRRVVRDHLFRGADAAFTLHLWTNVLRAESVNIFPFRGKADAEIDSSLAYEVPVMKQFALPLFRDIPAVLREATELDQVIDACGLFGDLDPKYIGDNSLLCEFIGDSGRSM